MNLIAGVGRLPLVRNVWQRHDDRDPMKTVDISAAELTVLCHIAGGLSDSDIATILCRSPHTIQTHRDHLMGKTNCHNRVELTRWAIAHGHVTTEWFHSER